MFLKTFECLSDCKLDPAWYYTAPVLACDALLKKTGVKLELPTDPNMLLFFEAGTRGGISICSNRYGKGNNPYMKGSYNPKEANKYLGYFDANNSYGYAMSQPQPTSGFKWMTTRQLKEWEKLPCVLEIDLEYPKSLHDLHNDYPLAPESIPMNGVRKLIPNLRNKKKYTVHDSNLKKMYLTWNEIVENL